VSCILPQRQRFSIAKNSDNHPLFASRSCVGVFCCPYLCVNDHNRGFGRTPRAHEKGSRTPGKLFLRKVSRFKAESAYFRLSRAPSTSNCESLSERDCSMQTTLTLRRAVVAAYESEKLKSCDEFSLQSHAYLFLHRAPREKKQLSFPQSSRLNTQPVIRRPSLSEINSFNNFRNSGPNFCSSVRDAASSSPLLCPRNLPS